MRASCQLAGTKPFAATATAMAEKKKVLLLGHISHAQEALQHLREISNVVEPKATNRKEFIQECESGQLDGVYAALRTFESVAITGLIDEELVQALPKSLKFLCHNGAGYDQVDVHACTGGKIQVSNVPTAVDESTADVTLFLILGCLRNFGRSMVNLRAVQWRGDVKLGNDPEDKVLGILGMGGIGRTLKRKVEGAFGMKVQYYNRNRLPPEEEDGAKYVSFDELLGTSDVISLNLPLNKDTRHIISTKEFSKMKDGVIIVNSARGAVIDEAALVEALDIGKVRSVGLDVFEAEPEVHPGLLRNPDCLLIPHLGTYTHETIKKMEEWCLDNVVKAVTTGKLKSPVSEQRNINFS